MLGDALSAQETLLRSRLMSQSRQPFSFVCTTSRRGLEGMRAWEGNDEENSAVMFNFSVCTGASSIWSSMFCSGALVSRNDSHRERRTKRRRSKSSG